MPTALPALATGRGVDLGRTLATVAALKGQALQNRLLEAKMKRQERVAGLAGKAAQEGTGSEAMAELSVLDPDTASAIIELDDKRAENLKRRIGMTGRLLMMVEDAPQDARPLAYAQARAQAQQMGLPMEGVPQQYDPRWTHQQIQTALAIDDKLREREELQKKDLVKVQTAKGPVYMKASEAEGKAAPDRSGLNVEFDEEGRVSGISMGQSGQLGRRAQGAAQTAVTENLQALDQIRQIESLYEPEFLTYPGMAKGKWATFLNKMDPDKRSEFQSRRAAFMSAANRSFLTFRKWATGVAGGEKEMAEIKRATFSEDDSPQDFESKLNLAKQLYRRLNARLRAGLKAGVDPTKNEEAFREFIKANPLENIPDINERGKQLEDQGYDQEKIVQILIDEGYITPAQ